MDKYVLIGQQHTRLTEGEKKVLYRDCYFKDTMPNLGAKDWFVRDHGKDNSNYNNHLRSFYKELVIICNREDGRIFCHYSQVTQQNIENVWIDTV